jgi:hypothetical protein
LFAYLISSFFLLFQDLFLELVELHAAADEARSDAARAPWLRRLRRLVGWLLALSGSWRVAAAVANVASATNQRAAWAHRGEGADLATSAWLWLQRAGGGGGRGSRGGGEARHLGGGPSGGLLLWSQCVGLVLVASLGLSSASGFLSAVQRARRASLTTHHAQSSSSSWALSAEALAPLTTLSLGAYLLGSLLLLRINMPCRFRHGALALVLGDVEFGFYHQWCARVARAFLVLVTLLFCRSFTRASPLEPCILGRH